MWSSDVTSDLVSVSTTTQLPRTHAGSRLRTLARHGVDALLDVGANAGQYAGSLRSDGFAGSIVSVEPLAEPYDQLARAAAADPGWVALRAALSARAGEVEMTVTSDTRCSSVLTPAAIVAIAGGVPVSRSRVTARTLDDVCAAEVPDDVRLALKLDVQGYEQTVLDGGPATLRRVRVLELEMPLVATYEGATLLPELLPALAADGWSVVSIECGHRDVKTGQVYDVDVLMERLA